MLCRAVRNLSVPQSRQSLVCTSLAVLHRRSRTLLRYCRFAVNPTALHVLCFRVPGKRSCVHVLEKNILYVCYTYTLPYTRYTSGTRTRFHGPVCASTVHYTHTRFVTKDNSFYRICRYIVFVASACSKTSSVQRYIDCGICFCERCLDSP